MSRFSVNEIIFCMSDERRQKVLAKTEKYYWLQPLNRGGPVTPYTQLIEVVDSLYSKEHYFKVGKYYSGHRCVQVDSVYGYLVKLGKAPYGPEIVKIPQNDTGLDRWWQEKDGPSV